MSCPAGICPPGATGPDGNPGQIIAGNPGLEGDRGPAGTQGDPGGTGPDGSQGATGDSPSGDAVSGPSGIPSLLAFNGLQWVADQVVPANGSSLELAPSVPINLNLSGPAPYTVSFRGVLQFVVSTTSGFLGGQLALNAVPLRNSSVGLFTYSRTTRQLPSGAHQTQILMPVMGIDSLPAIFLPTYTVAVDRSVNANVTVMVSLNTIALRQTK